jgi:hypothetical protein
VDVLADTIALLIPGMRGHRECTVEGEVAIGWSTTSNDGVRRLRKRRQITAETTTRMIPPMTPPAMAGVVDLREDGEAEARVEVGEGREGVGVGVATSISGL